MDNKTEYFVLQPDGKIYLKDGNALIEVSNQEQVKEACRHHDFMLLELNQVYPLECFVEKHFINWGSVLVKPFAHISIPK